MTQEMSQRWEGAFVGALTGKPDEETSPKAEVAAEEAMPVAADPRGALAAAARAEALEQELTALRRGLAPEQNDSALERQWLEFLERCPEVADPMNELPEPVWEAMAAGQSPVAAWLEHQNRTLREENTRLTAALAAVERGCAAAAKSPGSAVSPAGPVPSLDPFLEGLLGRGRGR